MSPETADRRDTVASWTDPFTTRDLADIRATECRHCGTSPGRPCTEADGAPCAPHRQRIGDALLRLAAP